MTVFKPPSSVVASESYTGYVGVTEAGTYVLLSPSGRIVRLGIPEVTLRECGLPTPPPPPPPTYELTVKLTKADLARIASWSFLAGVQPPLIDAARELLDEIEKTP